MSDSVFSGPHRLYAWLKQEDSRALLPACVALHSWSKGFISVKCGCGILCPVRSTQAFEFCILSSYTSNGPAAARPLAVAVWSKTMGFLSSAEAHRSGSLRFRLIVSLFASKWNKVLFEDVFQNMVKQRGRRCTVHFRETQSCFEETWPEEPH